MAKTKYYIKLSDEERTFLTKIVCEGKDSDRTIMRARILLMSDATQPERLSIKKLAEMLGTTDTTIKTVRTEYVNVGVEAAVYRKKRVVSVHARKINDEVIKRVLELTATEPPAGKKKWSSEMLCAALMEEGTIEHIGQTAVCKILREAAIENT